MKCEWHNCGENGKYYTVRSADMQFHDVNNYFPIGRGIQRAYCPLHREMAIMQGFEVNQSHPSLQTFIQ